MKDKSKLRSRLIYVCVTPEEWEAILKASEISDSSLSQFCRAAAVAAASMLDEKIKPRD